MSASVPTALGGRLVGGRFAGVRLDVGQYLALWRHLRLGERPVALAVLDHGATYEERDALDAAAWRRLGAQGLLDHRGAPDRWLVDALAVLARPARQVDVVVQAPDAEPRLIVGVARGGLGLAARLDDGGLLVEPADPHDLAGGLLARLPDVRPAPGVAMSLPAEALFGKGLSLDERSRRLRRAGVSPHRVERLRTFWSRPPDRAMTFGVAARDTHGRPHRGERTVTVLDTAAGRVSWGLDPTDRHVLVHPLDRPRLQAELGKLLDAHLRSVADR